MVFPSEHFSELLLLFPNLKKHMKEFRELKHVKRTHRFTQNISKSHYSFSE